MIKALRPITPKKVYFADEGDDRKCNGCTSDFSVTCLKHACRKCNKSFCGKCSNSSVTTVNGTLVRERLCTRCTTTQPGSVTSPNRSAGKSLFTPSKLHLLEDSVGKNAVSSLWSADTETDCDSDDCGDDDHDNGEWKSAKENLSSSLSDELIIASGNNASEPDLTMSAKKAPATSQVPVHVSRATPTVVPVVATTPRDDDVLRNLCNASFSDTLSATSSVSSRGSLIPRRSPAVQTMCAGCNVSFGTVFQRLLCSRCTKHFCEGCSTTAETIHYGMVYQQRVCGACVNTVPDTPFTPGTVHLEEASSVASTIPSGDINRSGGYNRGIAARLWSGGSVVSEQGNHHHHDQHQDSSSTAEERGQQQQGEGSSSQVPYQGSAADEQMNVSVNLLDTILNENDNEAEHEVANTGEHTVNAAVNDVEEDAGDAGDQEEVVQVEVGELSPFITTRTHLSLSATDSNHDVDAGLNDSTASEPYWGTELHWGLEDSNTLVNGVDPVTEASLQAKLVSMTPVHYPARVVSMRKVISMVLVVWVALCAVLWQPVYAFVESEPSVLGFAQPVPVPVSAPVSVVAPVVPAAPTSTPMVPIVHVVSAEAEVPLVPQQLVMLVEVTPEVVVEAVVEKTSQQGLSVVTETAAAEAPVVATPESVLAPGADTNKKAVVAAVKAYSAEAVARLLPTLLTSMFRSFVTKLQGLLQRVRFGGVRLFARGAVKQL